VPVALVIEHAMRMRHVILSSVSRLTVPYSSRYLLKGTILEKNVWNTQVKRVLILSTIFVRNIFHSKKTSARHHHRCT